MAQQQRNPSRPRGCIRKNNRQYFLSQKSSLPPRPSTHYNELNEKSQVSMAPSTTEYSSSKIGTSKSRNNHPEVPSDNTERNLLPPKTICKNRSLPTENFVFKFNGNVEICCGVAPQISPPVKQSNVLKPEMKEKISELIAHSVKNTGVKPNTSLKVETSHTKTEMTTKTNQQQSDKRVNQTCTCENCDNFIECPYWCSMNVNFEESNTNEKIYPLLKSATVGGKNIIHKCNTNIVFHGALIPNPVSNLNDSYFHANIQNSLKQLDCNVPNDIQSYVWPAVWRNLNVFLIGPPRVGKTLAYLPALCSSMLHKDDKYSDLMKYKGPIIIILCSNLQNCDKTHALTTSLLRDHCRSVAVQVLSDQFKPEDVYDCDILITIPAILEKALKSGSVQLKRVCHVALKNAHVLLKNYTKSMAKLLKVLNRVQLNRPHGNMQMIVSSEKWSANVEALLKHLYATPTVYFQDFLEAAIYSKVNFKTKKVHSRHKLFSLEDMLKKFFEVHKTVVFCNDSDILGIKEHFQIIGIDYIMIPSDSTEDDILENEDVWCSLERGKYQVLVCTDALLEKTHRISNAEWLVHYHMPTEWTVFSKRFRCLASTLRSPLNHIEDVNDVNLLHSFLIIDEGTDQELFLNFLKSFAENSAQSMRW